MVDQQHRFPRRAAGRHQHRYVLDRAAHARLPAGHRGRDAAPVRTVVNTHHHGDHTFGNCLFPGATIVGHERAREEAIAFGPPRPLPFWDHVDWGDLTLDPPFLTFADRITVHAGDLRAELRTRAPLRTRRTTCSPGSRSTRCSFAAISSSTEARPSSSWGRSPERSRCWRTWWRRCPPIVVPGHGPVFSGAEPVRATLDYLRFVLDIAERGRQPESSPSMPRATPTSAGSPTGRTPSASSGTCTAPTPSWAAPPAVAPSTSSQRSRTWSPTTAGTRSPATRELARRPPTR